MHHGCKKWKFHEQQAFKFEKMLNNTGINTNTEAIAERNFIPMQEKTLTIDKSYGPGIKPARSQSFMPSHASIKVGSVRMLDEKSVLRDELANLSDADITEELN
jgi:hypothetical protein